jgi:hypothetical protein
MANAPLDASQIQSIVADLSAIGDAIRTILNDPDSTLTDDQSDRLAVDLTAVSDEAAPLATQAALVTFADSDAAFSTIRGATQTACAKLDALEANLAKISATISIAAAAVSLGTAFASGNVSGILTAASNLASAATSA